MRSKTSSASTVAKAVGIDNLEVKALLAHTNLSTTEKYMGSFDTSKNDEALETIFKKKVSDVDIEDTLLKQLEGISPEVLQRVMAKLQTEQQKQE